MLGLKDHVSAGLLTGFMQQSSRDAHMKAVAKAEAAAAAKEAENKRELQKIKDDAAAQRTIATARATFGAARYRADAAALSKSQRLQFDMLREIPTLSDQGVFSLNPKDHFTRTDDGTIIPITPWFKLYFNKDFPDQSMTTFTQALKMQKDRKKETNKWANYPVSLQEYFLLKKKKGKESPSSYYNHLQKIEEAGRKLTTLEANYKAYVKDTVEFNKGIKDKNKDKVKSILPFEYWFGLNASKVAGTTERKRARDMLNDYRDGKLPASLIYVDPNAKNREVHPHLISTLYKNGLLIGENVETLRRESERHAKLFYNKERLNNQLNIKHTGRMHITDVAGLQNLGRVIPNISDAESVLQETYGQGKPPNFNAASDMLARLMKLGLFGKAGVSESDENKVDRIKESGSYNYIISLLDTMSQGVKTVEDDYKVTTYYNLEKRMRRTLQILTKIDSNLPISHKRFFTQRDEIIYEHPDKGSLITKIPKGKLGDDAFRKLNIALHLEKNNHVFKKLSDELKVPDQVGHTSENLLKAYRYFFPFEKNPIVVGDERNIYNQSQKLVLENPFLSIISPYLSGFGNLLVHKSDRSTREKTLKDIVYPRKTVEGRKIGFWIKRDKLRESQQGILQLIDTTLTHAGSINNDNIRDKSLNELIKTLNSKNWKITTGIGSAVFQAVSDTLKGMGGVFKTYSEEIKDMSEQFTALFLNNKKSQENMIQTQIRFSEEAEKIEKQRRDMINSNPGNANIQAEADRRFALRSIILFNKVQLTYKLAGLVQGDQTGGRTISNQDFDTVWKHLWGKSELSNLANLSALKKDISLRTKMGDAFDVIYEFEGHISGELRRAANEIHNDQTKRWEEIHPEHALNAEIILDEKKENNVSKLNTLIGLKKALEPMTIRSGKIANINYDESVNKLKERMRIPSSPKLKIPYKFINSALYLSTIVSHPEKRQSLLNKKSMRIAAYSLAISSGKIYGTKNPLDTEFTIDKLNDDGKGFNSESFLYNNVLNGNKDAFQKLLNHMNSIDFRNHDPKTEISIATQKNEKKYLIKLLKYTKAYFDRGS